MTSYTVKYRRKGDWLWRTLKNVKGDLLAPELPGSPRVFILADETRVEVPAADGLEIRFSKERFIVIKQNMERDAGQVLPVIK
jgi:hypothetical protein